MFPLYALIITLLLGIANNNMKSFKQYLIEEADQIKCDVNGICKVIKEYESAGNEKKILSVYKDSKQLPTIGHGHLITADSPKIFGEVFAEQEKAEPGFISGVLSGKKSLTPEQADTLFKRDVTARLPEIKKMVPKFETYSPNLQAQLASEHFRGMLGKSPKAVRMLNAGDFAGASKEFLNAKDYRDAVAQKSGIQKRMENLSSAMAAEPGIQKPTT
jgi:hypothetical protein